MVAPVRVSLTTMTNFKLDMMVFLVVAYGQVVLHEPRLGVTLQKTKQPAIIFHESKHFYTTKSMTLLSPYHLNPVCKNGLTPDESQKRIEKVIKNLNEISSDRYGGSLFKLLPNLNGTNFKKKSDDPKLPDSRRLINLNETQLMKNLAQCQRKDTQCVMKPIIRSPRIAFESSQEPELAFLPCYTGEESKIASSCNKIAALTLCCRRDHQESNCQLESELEIGRKVLRDWIEIQFDGKYLFRYSYREDPKWVPASRFNYCFKLVAIVDSKLGKERTLGSNVIPDLGRTWSSVYEVEDTSFNPGPDDLALAKLMTSQIDVMDMKLFKRKGKNKSVKSGDAKTGLKPSEVKLSASKHVAATDVKSKTDTKLSVKLAFQEFRKQQKSLAGLFGKSRRKSKRKGRSVSRYRRDMSLQFLEIASRQDEKYKDLFPIVFDEGLEAFVNQKCGITRWSLFKRFLHNLREIKVSLAPLSEDSMTQVRSIIDFTGNQLEKEKCQPDATSRPLTTSETTTKSSTLTPAAVAPSTSSNPVHVNQVQLFKRSSGSPTERPTTNVTTSAAESAEEEAQVVNVQLEPVQPVTIEVEQVYEPEDVEFDLESMEQFKFSMFDIIKPVADDVPAPIDHNAYIGQKKLDLDNKNLEFMSQSQFDFTEACAGVTSDSMTKYYLKVMEKMHEQFLLEEFSDSKLYLLCSMLTDRKSSVCRDKTLVREIFEFEHAGFKVLQETGQVKLQQFFAVKTLVPIPDRETSIWSVSVFDVYFGPSVTIDSVRRYTTAKLATETRFVVMRNNSLVTLGDLNGKCGQLNNAESEVFMCEAEMMLVDSSDHCIKSVVLEDELGVMDFCEAVMQMSDEPCLISRVGTTGFAISAHSTATIRLSYKEKEVQDSCIGSCVVDNHWNLLKTCSLGHASQTKENRQFQVQLLDTKVDISRLLHQSIIETLAEKFDLDEEHLQDAEIVSTAVAVFVLAVWWGFRIAKGVYYLTRNKKFGVSLKKKTTNSVRPSSTPLRPASDLSALIELLRHSNPPKASLRTVKSNHQE